MPKDNWKNDNLQFMRVVAEANAAGAFTKRVVIDMATSMDLTFDEVEQLIDRAEVAFERWKATIARPLKTIPKKRERT